MNRAPRIACRTLAHALAAGVGLILLSGCGYQVNGAYRTGIRSIYVEMFESHEFRRDLEFMLTEAVKKRIGSDTPYRLASKEKADTVLSGEILEERQAAFAPDFISRLPREKQLTLGVRLRWQDIRNGKLLVEQPVLLQAVDYLTPTGETEKYAQQKVIDRLAARIVSKMYDEEW